MVFSSHVPGLRVWEARVGVERPIRSTAVIPCFIGDPSEGVQGLSKSPLVVACFSQVKLPTVVGGNYRISYTNSEVPSPTVSVFPSRR
jgi:hypothetical protein